MAVWSQVMSSKIDYNSRIDSDYFLPEYLRVEEVLNKFDVRKITECFFVADGNHLEVSKYFTTDKTDIPYYRGKDINNFFLDNSDPIRIPREIYDSGMMKRSHFRSEDVLLSIVGTIGSLSIVPVDFQDATGSCKIAILRKKKDYSPYVLSAFLASKYGQSQIKRNTRGAVQMGLILKDFVHIRIPVFSTAHENEIELLVRESINKNKQSKQLYSQAQQLLEYELGLNNLVLEKPKSYKSSFSEIVSGSRVDAEYYNPQANEIYQADCFNNSIPLKTMFSILRGQTPTQYFKEGTPVLKTKNIRIPIIDETKVEDFSNLSGNYTTMKNGDLILAAMGVGSLGRISYVFDDSSNAIIDGTLRILRSKEGFNNQVIPALLFLTSEYGQILIYKGIIGSTGIISLPDSHLKNIKIPIINSEAAEKITEIVLSSYNARKQSEQLLEQAKRRVEELIEGGTGA